MMQTAVTSEYRNQLFIDVYEGKVPDRIPEKLGVNGAAALELAGYDILTAQYGSSKYIDAIDKFNAKYDTDMLTGGVGGATPYYTKMIGSRTNIMGVDGFMQHPNVYGMEVEEYDDFIKDPIKFIWDVVIPRLFTEFARPWPHNAFALLKMVKTRDEVNGNIFRASALMQKKYNKVTIPLSRGISRAPFDYLADYLRSFTGALTDMRRIPKKVMEAVDAITPLMIKCGTPRPAPTNRTTEKIFFALHMPTYMRVKDFEKFWWPSFKETIWSVYNAGFGISVFCEEDWMRMLDYLDELPELCELQFEYGDTKIIKEKVGTKHIIQGMYPVHYLTAYSEEQVCDKAKEMMDVFSPGGKYIFGFDKSILRARQIKWDNLSALIDCVHTYGKY